MIAPVIFTYSKDGACAIEAAGALKDVGFGEVLAFEDAKNPLAVDTLKELSKSAEILQSSHPNPGGQFGIECLRGILSCYRMAFALTGADYVLKVDSDTVVRDASRIRLAAFEKVSAAAWTWHGWEFSGCCALISIRAVLRATRLLAKPPSWIGERCPEDITMGRIAAEVGEVRRFPYDPAGGFCAGFRYGATPLEEYARRFEVVTFGNRHLLTGRDCERREKVAFTMARFRRICAGGG